VAAVGHAVRFEDNGSFLEGDDEVGAPVAIKDVWLDDDRPREGATLTRLLEEASKDDKPLLKKIFTHSAFGWRCQDR
jgi:hypothetical protein